jgi:hypothetical protein
MLSTLLRLVGCLVALMAVPAGGARARSTDYDFFVYLPLILSAGTGTPRPGPAVVTNGDFEAGRTGWVEYQDSPFYEYELIVHASRLINPIVPHEGEWAVWLGGDAELITAIEQEITVPEAASALVYWHWIDAIFACDGSAGGVALDGTTVDEYPLCADADTGGWVRRSVDLTAYAGRTVQLRFASQTEAGNYSSLYIDTVSVQETP